MVQNILITGGAGYIGSHIANYLQKKGYNIFIIDDLSTGKKSQITKNSIFLKENLLNFKKIYNFIKTKKIDTVIHCAASINVEESMVKKKFYFKNNVTATNILVNIIKKLEIKNFIFSSTSSVYGSNYKMLTEDSKTKPINYYAKTKLKCENIIKKKLIPSKFNVVILRYFNVSGSNYLSNLGQFNNNNQLMINLCNFYLDKKKYFNIYGKNYETKDGTCVRDFIHVLDLADIHWHIVRKFKIKKINLIVNCGYGKGYTVLEIVKKFQKLTNYSFNIKYLNRRKGDIPKSVTSVKLLKKKLKWKPKYNSLNKIILSDLKWQKKLKKLF